MPEAAPQAALVSKHEKPRVLGRRNRIAMLLKARGFAPPGGIPADSSKFFLYFSKPCPSALSSLS
jgi:hypothetical protein